MQRSNNLAALKIALQGAAEAGATTELLVTGDSEKVTVREFLSRDKSRLELSKKGCFPVA